VTGALEHIADRVQHLVDLDAFVPDDGDTALGLTLGLGRLPAMLGEDWLVPAPSANSMTRPRRHGPRHAGEFVSLRGSSGHPGPGQERHRSAIQNVGAEPVRTST
jgi:hypothetical protein